MQLPSVLTVAGSDSSGGAGIQADLKTIAALGLYGQSVITALTAQNTCGVRSIQETTVQVVIDQMDTVFEDIRPAAVKIGMLSTSQIARTVAQGLRRHGAGHIVVDPVMVATSGAALMADGASRSMVDELFCLAQVVTPNIPEASVLAGIDAAAQGLDSMVQAARIIARTTPGKGRPSGGGGLRDRRALAAGRRQSRYFARRSGADAWHPRHGLHALKCHRVLLGIWPAG